MSAGMVQGLWTLLALLFFIGVVVWAFHPNRKKDFEQAARLALDDEDPVRPETEKEDNG